MPSEVIATPAEIEAEVLDNEEISEAGFLLTLGGKMPGRGKSSAHAKTSALGKMPTPLPGQFFMVGLPREGRFFLRRPFSVLDFEPASNRLQIYYSVIGEGTRALSRVPPGSRLELLGPLGRPFPRSIGVMDVIIGGGRGIAPLVFLSRTAPRKRKTLFFAGAGSEAGLVFLDKVKAGGIFVSTDDGSLGMKGTVMDLLRGFVSRTSFDWSRSTFYGCGPAGLLKELHGLCLRLNAACFASLEARMGCGVGVCQGCAVKNSGAGYSLVCKDGPVFESARIDWESYEVQR